MKTRYKLYIADPENFDKEVFEENLSWILKHVRFLGNHKTIGMKQGRDLLETLINKPLDAVILEGEEINRNTQFNAIEQLALLGVIAEPDGPLSTIKEAAFEAMELGHYDLCKDILEVLLKHGGK